MTSLDLETDPDLVRARFEWALRQGNPVWLWPEIDPKDWRAAVSEIERATRHVLAGAPGTATVAGDPAAFGIAAFTSGMGPLLGHWADAGLIQAEPAVLAVVKAHLAHNQVRMGRLGNFAHAAVEALARAGVDVLVLKGMHTAYCYFPVPGTRPLSDIDLLIDRSAERVAAETLSSLGYLPGHVSVGEQTWRLEGITAVPKSLWLVHQDSPWTIDLHTSLDGKYSPGARTIRLDRAVASRNTVRWPLSPGAEALTGADLVHYLACHASLGLDSLSLLRLTELVLVIRRLEEEDGLSWSRLMELAARTGSPGSSYPALHMANRLAPGVVPDEIENALGRNAPAAVRRVLGSLTPATCQRIRRNSLAERFMWTETLSGWIRELWGSLFPRVGLRRLLGIYKFRVACLLSGAITR